ncbi:MAG: peptidylprolyl isomerase, partial [Salinivirgaceae bacterium]|nr:peptidylprolyl isomerase [Salinivirgaceae bacterium]
MKSQITFISIAASLLLMSAALPIKNQEKKKKVLIETVYGNMVVQFYDETPKHRDNFIKLAGQKYFDSLLFHRVIRDFMIQGGDPDSKGAPAESQLGNGGPGYEIDAEFIPSLYHKKGVIAAAREGDQVNPQKKSSGSQFYIVQGKALTMEQLKQMEEKINFPKKKQLVFNYIERPENRSLKLKIDSLQKIRDLKSLNEIFGEISKTVEPEYQKLELFKYSEEQI